MKTKLIASIIALVFLTSQAVAKDNKKETSTTKTTSSLSLPQQIKKNVGYPNFAKNVMTTEEVYLTFTVTKDSLLEIKEASTDNPHLKAYVMEQLNNIKVMVDGNSINKSYAIKLVFE
jgi:diaminopimelate epimerase